MTTILIIHGYAGHSKENWFPWLKQQLEALDHTVIVPDFPHPSDPNLSSWLNYFKQYDTMLDHGCHLIDHSLGGAFLLSWLENHPAKAAYLVASVSGPLDHEVDAKISTFTHKSFSWKKIRANCQHFSVLHSNNDPYIPLKQARQLAENLGTKVQVIAGGGHLNSVSEYTEFKLLLKQIKENFEN